MWITSSPAKSLTPSAVALGNFDGVHRGHQKVIQPVLNFAGASLHNYATVVTFNPHPQEFFTGQSRALLTPVNEKVQQLLRLGVEQLVLLPFDQELAALSPQQFVDNILVQQLSSQRISVGEDFRFGRSRGGNATELQAIAATYGIPVTIVPLQTCEGERISSSSIRKALQQGDLQCANQLLGRPYTLIGTVVKGQQLGRTIGFPTANVQVPPKKFLPRQGVYAVRVLIAEGTQSIQEEVKIPQLFNLESEQLSDFVGVMNIGYRPTVDGTNPTVEVHLLNWCGDLYGKTITVQLEKFLRPEQKFASLEALKAQIQADCAIASSFLQC